jgi:hypothetical protein
MLRAVVIAATHHLQPPVQASEPATMQNVLNFIFWDFLSASADEKTRLRASLRRELSLCGATGVPARRLYASAQNSGPATMSTFGGELVINSLPGLVLREQ